MSIASEITRITGNVADSYTAANAKGATMPATQDSDHLAATIATIPSGITPTGTMYIISNGTYNVADKAIANVNVPTTAPAHYIEKGVDANGKLISTSSFIDLTGVTKIGSYGLAYVYSAYRGGIVTDNSSYDPNVVALNNVDIDLSNITLEAYALEHFLYGRKGINSLTLGQFSVNVGGQLCPYSDIKRFTYTGTTIGSGFLTYSFYKCTSMQTLSCPNLTQIHQGSCSNMCALCTSLTTVNMSELQRIGLSAETGNYSTATHMFEGCSQLQSIDLNKLEEIHGGMRTSASAQYMFADCSSLVTVGLDRLRVIGNADYSGSSDSKSIGFYMFSGCTSLRNMKFKSLEQIGTYGLVLCFKGCTSLESLWFYALTTINDTSRAMSAMLSGCTNVTAHFPLALQSTYSSDTRFTGGFGGTNTTVLFDLVTSLTGADSNTYARSEKDSTATATAWTYNDTLYYTSGVSDDTNGVNEPAVGDTIYSDAACTIAATTISAIA